VLGETGGVSVPEGSLGVVDADRVSLRLDSGR
jgi:hypothetical protein